MTSGNDGARVQSCSHLRLEAEHGHLRGIRHGFDGWMWHRVVLRKFGLHIGPEAYESTFVAHLIAVVLQGQRKVMLIAQVDAYGSAR